VTDIVVLLSMNRYNLPGDSEEIAQDLEDFLVEYYETGDGMRSRVCAYHEMELPSGICWCINHEGRYVAIWEIYSWIFIGCTKTITGWATLEMILDANLGEVS
jgi:hypothetical protein